MRTPSDRHRATSTSEATWLDRPTTTKSLAGCQVRRMPRDGFVSTSFNSTSSSARFSAGVCSVTSHQSTVAGHEFGVGSFITAWQSPVRRRVPSGRIADDCARIDRTILPTRGEKSVNRSTVRGLHSRGFMNAISPGIDILAKTWNLMLTVPRGPNLNQLLVKLQGNSSRLRLPRWANSGRN